MSKEHKEAREYEYIKGRKDAIAECIKEIEALRNSNEGCYGGISNCEYGCIDVIIDKLKAMQETTK
jgi:hypothetical protein